MPTFLWFYVAGLGAALVVGFVFYYAVGAYCGPVLERLFGQRGAHLWGRSFRMMIVTCALVGGLSTQWYGCGGYTDYDRVEKDRQAMFQKSTEQVAGAINYARNFLVVAAGIGAVVFAFLWRGRQVEQARSAPAATNNDTTSTSEVNPRP